MCGKTLHRPFTPLLDSAAIRDTHFYGNLSQKVGNFTPRVGRADRVIYNPPLTAPPKDNSAFKAFTGIRNDQRRNSNPTDLTLICLFMNIL